VDAFHERLARVGLAALSDRGFAITDASTGRSSKVELGSTGGNTH